MTYNTEDEVDWSDSPLGPPSPQAVEPFPGLDRLSPATDLESGEQLVAETHDQFTIAPSSPLPFSTHIQP
jgi:hypothetical protein